MAKHRSPLDHINTQLKSVTWSAAGILFVLAFIADHPALMLGLGIGFAGIIIYRRRMHL